VLLELNLGSAPMPTNGFIAETRIFLRNVKVVSIEDRDSKVDRRSRKGLH
jgi:hypothetical protein